MDPIRPARKRRKPSMTPMIDVVFLLLVFFMLASRFGIDQAIPLPLAGAGQGYSGPPRLVEILPEGLMLNGMDTTPEELAPKLTEMTEAPTDTIILQGRDGANLQRVVDVTHMLNAAGFATLVLIE
ncbi:MAG: indolepyruvate ferredoxin oxidoreductase [Rhodobacteraceae bacterium]|nr:indolepyruvate ferredoxin oxidoreductase [Paracoccaceae bacterium]MAY44366.1 indolepyruvate ferredoxin oxidoreductase [Paracoccaceae bacterium]QEW18035.1 biopolymer transport protein ExbD [Marinibacterium anthonyi]